MPKWLKISIGLLFAIVIIVIAAGVIFYNVLNSSLPEYNGELVADKISSEITVYRDTLAIPYIKAANDFDAAFALGYLHAQERLFSMDFARRAGEGRLSEVLGSKTLPFDRMFLTIGIKKDAKEILKNLNPTSLKLLQSYSDGINLYLKENKGKYTVEFDVLNYDPYEWTPEHSIIIIRMMAWQLNISWWVDFAFSDIVLKLGETKAREILPAYDENGPYIIPDELKKISSLPLGFMHTDMVYRQMFGYSGTHVGSNSWVVNKNKSVTGNSILANDPHLAYSAPGRWYAAVIKSGNETVSGVSLPGAPGIVIGNNDYISWGLTNVMADDADFYIEKFDSTGKNYFLNGSWQKLREVKETIKVKDSLDVILKIQYTHRGPIISDIHPYNILYRNKGIITPKISMRWTGNDISDELFAFYRINKAKNWNEFKSAAQLFSVPGQNFIYGDKDGNIGYQFGAKLPIRGVNNPTFVYDGTTDKYDWKGFVSMNELPCIYNPAQNYLASANNKTVKEFKHHISNLWEPKSRIQRIDELLKEKQMHSINDYMDYQNDFISPYAKEMTKHILEAFKDKKIKDKNLREVIELFNKWDYSLNEYSQTAAVYELFLKYLFRNIYYDEMGHDLYNEFLFMANAVYRSVMQVLNDPRNSWFDNVNTSEIETKEEIIRKSLIDALTELETNHGRDLKLWQWGRLHLVTFKHAFSGFSSLIDPFVNIGPFEIGGDGTTLFNTQYAFNEGIKDYPRFNHEEYENDVGPSMRYIFNFAQPDQFYLVLNTGQSGNIMSDHYKDMSDMWLRGKYILIRTDEESFSKNQNVMRIRK